MVILTKVDITKNLVGNIYISGIRVGWLDIVEEIVCVELEYWVKEMKNVVGWRKLDREWIN